MKLDLDSLPHAVVYFADNGAIVEVHRPATEGSLAEVERMVFSRPGDYAGFMMGLWALGPEAPRVCAKEGVEQITHQVTETPVVDEKDEGKQVPAKKKGPSRKKRA